MVQQKLCTSINRRELFHPLAPSCPRPLSIISHKHFLAKSTSNCSRSMVDTVLIACPRCATKLQPQWGHVLSQASTKTPNSMFITVRDPKRMKNNIKMAMTQLSCKCKLLKSSWDWHMFHHVEEENVEPLSSVRTRQYWVLRYCFNDHLLVSQDAFQDPQAAEGGSSTT